MTMRNARPLAPRVHSRSGGFTLLELLISLTIGLVILAASLSTYVAASRGSQLSQTETQLNEDGILAINLLQQQLKQAGYSRQILPSGSPMSNFAGPAVRGCDGGFSDTGAAFDSLTCVAGNGSDAIAVRYEATIDNTMPTAATPTLATNCLGNGINAVTGSQALGATPPAANYALADNRYSVADATSTLPVLTCRGSEKNGATTNAIGTAEPLLSNVESMQILYGVATQPSNELAASYDPMRHQIISYQSATQIDVDTAGDRWSRVLSVRVCLLMRSDQPVRDVPTGGASYKDCSNVDQTGTDGYLRRSYTTTVLLRNRLIIP